VLLLAHNGDRERPEDRYYFASPYHSWHGSPSRKDSRMPLIVAHPKKTTAELKAIVSAQLGAQPRAQGVGRLLLALRARTISSKPKAPRPR
jgi:hypothetical protein